MRYEEQIGAKQLAIGTIVSTIFGYVLIRYMLGLPIIPDDGQLFGDDGSIVITSDYGFSPIGTFLVSLLMAVGSISMAMYQIITSLAVSAFGVITGVTKHGGAIADTIKSGVDVLMSDNDMVVDIDDVVKEQIEHHRENKQYNGIKSKPDAGCSGQCSMVTNKRIILVIEPDGNIHRDATIEHIINTPTTNNIAKNAFWSGDRALLLETFDKVHSAKSGENDVK